MPSNKKEKLLFALITVAITVPCFVFYCLSIENGGLLNVDYKYALKLIPIEFILAYLSATLIASPLSTKIALKKVNPKDHPEVIIQTAIVCTTACIMCPIMSLFATILYTGIFPGLIFKDPTFTINNFFIYFIPNFLQTFTINFPFAILTQLFYIQPLTRKIFKLIVKKV